MFYRNKTTVQRRSFSLCPVIVLLMATILSAAEPVDYKRDIKPVLREHCFACHGSLRQESELRLDAIQLIRKGVESGPLVVPGKSKESYLVEVLTGDAGFSMPPEGEGIPLTSKQLALLKRWIDEGAKGPKEEELPQDPRQFWSYQPPKRPAVPGVKNTGWVLNPIDAFIAAEHEKRSLTPRPPAEKATLLRRVYLDLIGLPPTREELHLFLADDSEKAYEKVVDRLLNSPKYGERWGRHWMDIWRYSDWYGSRGGNEIRYSQRHIWRWRDWIIESLNADKGYDRMIVEMLAGDEVAPDDPDIVRATGFLGRNWYKFDRNVWMRELVEHTAMGFMSVTVKCARCHDHKFDPISQLDYYQFRAFFEPHDFRIDQVAASINTRKDAKTGKILKDGLSRIYDKQLDVPTYRFIRGDGRYPDKESPLQPGVIPVFGNTEIKVEPVSLPVDSYYPALRPFLVKKMIANAQQKMEQAEQAVAAAKKTIVTAEDQLAAVDDSKASANAETPLSKPILYDDFSKPREELWKPVSGTWEYKDGDLVQSAVGTFLTTVAQVEHPQDFQARVRYTTTDPGSIHSVGIGFDVVDLKSWQAIYTHVNSNGSGVQAFHRQNSREAYPSAGIVKTPISLNREVILDVAACGQTLNVWVNGELKIVYTMPTARQAGQFALWCHAGTARFHEVRIEALPETWQPATGNKQPKKSPFDKPSKPDFAQNLKLARHVKALADSKLELSRREFALLEARVAADRAKIADAENFKELSLAAGKAMQLAAVAKAETAFLEAKQQLDVQEKSVPVKDGKPHKAVAHAEKALKAAQTDAMKDTEKYTPLGTVYPKTSTGRRLALARWIATARNPRTSRVAVNHMWLRHFGKAIVPSVSEFGTRSKPRSHPELLDWLAMELSENNWSMKHLHRLMVNSNTYRMQTSAGDSPSNAATDPENRFLWRMNSRRMEAEVVRDSIFYLAGKLDMTMKGPELVETLGQSVPRRSLYFRMTPNETMEFLELFDLANPNECYERTTSVVPQQVLAMTNSAISLSHSRLLARELTEKQSKADPQKTDTWFITAAFEQVLGRAPTPKEQLSCERFLKSHSVLLKNSGKLTSFPANPQGRVAPSTDPALRARENLVHVLFNHNDFVTIR
jgi:hypothetical protein